MKRRLPHYQRREIAHTSRCCSNSVTSPLTGWEPQQHSQCELMQAFCCHFWIHVMTFLAETDGHHVKFAPGMCTSGERMYIFPWFLFGIYGNWEIRNALVLNLVLLSLNVKHYLSICTEGAPLTGKNVTESWNSFHFLWSLKLTQSGCGA